MQVVNYDIYAFTVYIHYRNCVSIIIGNFDLECLLEIISLLKTLCLNSFGYNGDFCLFFPERVHKGYMVYGISSSMIFSKYHF